MKGPTVTEKAAGVFTSINDGVTVKALTIVKGVARVDFDKSLEREVGGSCRVSAIRSQIENTLKQFSSVSSVIISVDGNSQDVLQP